MFEKINELFATATGALGSVASFIGTIANYLSDPFIVLTTLSVVGIVGLCLQFRKFFPEMGPFLGAISLASITYLAGIFVEKNRQSPVKKKPVSKKRPVREDWS